MTVSQCTAVSVTFSLVCCVVLSCLHELQHGPLAAARELYPSQFLSSAPMKTCIYILSEISIFVAKYYPQYYYLRMRRRLSLKYMTSLQQSVPTLSGLFYSAERGEESTARCVRVKVCARPVQECRAECVAGVSVVAAVHLFPVMCRCYASLSCVLSYVVSYRVCMLCHFSPLFMSCPVLSHCHASLYKTVQDWAGCDSIG